MEVMLEILPGHSEYLFRHADGTPTGGLDNVLDSFRPLEDHQGRTRAAEFSPSKVKAVRVRMIDAGLARSTIDRRIGRIIHLFR